MPNRRARVPPLCHSSIYAFANYDAVIISKKGWRVWLRDRETTERMVLVTATSILLALLCLTAQSTAQVDCTALANAGNCNFYDCLNTRFQCGPTDYPLAYGKRYCLRFASKSNCFTAPVSQQHTQKEMMC